MGVAALWLYHAVLMTLGFVSLVTGMLIARYLKRRRWWLKAHQMMGILGSILLISGLFMAIYMVSLSTGVHFRVPHAYLGAIVLVLVVINPILGYAQLKYPSKAAKIRSIHRWFGYLALVLILINIIAGLVLVGII
ncbi:MAG: hypothetical protein IBX41_05125 [Methanophagales archaeon]|nr:hypothetical protein [Methanophagales archaeon]